MEQLSHEEIEKMRRIVQSADAQRQPMKTIDLNNPPREPYHFQRFPKMVYHHGSSVPGSITFLVVHDEDQMTDAFADGYSHEAPAFGEAPEEHLSAAYQAEAAAVQEQIETTRRKPGPKPKAA